MKRPTAKRDETISILTAAMRRFELRGRSSETRTSPAGGIGIEPRSLVEWIGEGDGGGVVALAFAAGASSNDPNLVSVLVDGGTFFPAALADLDRLLVVRPRDEREAMWSAERVLRCSAVGLTVWSVDRLRSHQGRRAKLAVEHGGGVGMLVRPWRARREACWADVRYLVRPLCTPVGSWDRRWRIEVAYRRGEVPGETFEVTMCHETGRLRVDSELADAAAGVRAS